MVQFRRLHAKLAHFWRWVWDGCYPDLPLTSLHGNDLRLLARVVSGRWLYSCGRMGRPGLRVLFANAAFVSMEGVAPSCREFLLVRWRWGLGEVWTTPGGGAKVWSSWPRSANPAHTTEVGK
jgi:hypothetical protein